MINTLFKRNCPTCGKELTYNRKGNFTVASNENVKCVKCAHPKQIKIVKDKIIKDNHYWREIQDEAMIKFINSTDQVERDSIFNTYLKDPFQKIVSSVWHRSASQCQYVLNYHGDIGAQQLGYEKMVDLLESFDIKKGKFYSYFTFCLFRVYKGENEKLQNYVNSQVEIKDSNLDEDDGEMHTDKIELSTTDKLHDNIDFKEYLGYLTKYVEVNFNSIVRSDKQKRALTALIKIMKKSDSFDFNKKTIYREMRTDAGVSTSNFTHVVLRVKDIHTKLFGEYKNTGKCEIPVLQTEKPKSRKHIFTLIHISTKQIIEGKRTHIHKKLSNVSSKRLDNLLYGKSKDCNGWKIIS